jgi:hypothetical protein
VDSQLVSSSEEPVLLTKANDVEKPIPPRFTPVTKIVFPLICPANVLATSKPSVSWLNSEWVVDAIFCV